MKASKWYPLWGFLYGLTLLVAAWRTLSPGMGNSFISVLATSPLIHLAQLTANRLIVLLTLNLGGLFYWTLLGFGLKHVNRPIPRTVCALALIANYAGILSSLVYTTSVLSRVFLSPSGLVYILGQVVAWRVIVMAQAKRG